MFLLEGELFAPACGLLFRSPDGIPEGGASFAIKPKTCRIPPRPEVIRERYAEFLREHQLFLENYKQRYLSGMARRFPTGRNRRTE